MRHSGIEAIGWDAQTYILSNVNNLIASLIAGLSKGADLEAMLITPPALKRSGEPQSEPERPMTIAEFSVSGFGDFMYGKG